MLMKLDATPSLNGLLSKVSTRPAVKTNGRNFPAPSGPRAGLRDMTMVRWVLDVAHQAVRAPLRMGFRLAAQREAGSVQALVVPDLAKHWLQRADTLAIWLSAVLQFAVGAVALRWR